LFRNILKITKFIQEAQM